MEPFAINAHYHVEIGQNGIRQLEVTDVGEARSGHGCRLDVALSNTSLPCL